MQIEDFQKRQELGGKLTRIVRSWIQDMGEDLGKALLDIQVGRFQKAFQLIQDFLAKDQKEIVLIEAQLRLDAHDKGLLKQNMDVITLSELAQLALSELKNDKGNAATVLLHKMQLLVAEVEECELSQL
ncbi:hypothetical protein J4457_04050 [Candidatus Woesearchaeota archaeon]|nr:hypothetical protein [Candidatus Woesearchaeota archaeon]